MEPRWQLPFYRVAEHVTELGLWFRLQQPPRTNIVWNHGPEAHQHRLCAFDLSASAMMNSAAPSSLHAWEYVDSLPDDEWLLVERALVNLGSGRFCIATQFQKKFSPSPEEEEFWIRNDEQTVLTGVEMVRTGDGLQMIKHKSEHYNIKNTRIYCVL